jgi:hypothetical protein
MAKIEIYIGGRDCTGFDCDASRRASCAFGRQPPRESESGCATVFAEQYRLPAARFRVGLRDYYKYLSHEHGPIAASP